MKQIKLGMKQHYKKTSTIASGIVMLLLIGLLIGYLITNWIANKKIEEINADNQFTHQMLVECESELAITKNDLNEYRQYKDKFVLEQEKNISLQTDLDETLEAVNVLEETINVLKSDEYQLVYIGDFEITYYCDERYDHICGGSGVTASGNPTEVGWTVAADTSVLPMGSIIYIEGLGFREVQDVGGAVNGNHIDVLMQTHSECFEQTLLNGGVWVLVKQ